MDIAVNLVESYLRLTGYLTLAEIEVQKRTEEGAFRAVTDVDIMAVRLPGAVYVGDPHHPLDAEMMLIDDPALHLVADCVDVIIGEVKQGPAELNPGILDHAVLHSMLRRVAWVYDDGDVEPVVIGLQDGGTHFSEARGGGLVRTRLVAFGRSEKSDLNTIALGHVVTTLLRFFEEHEPAFRPVQFRDPAPALLRLLLKAGFDVRKEEPEE